MEMTPWKCPQGHVLGLVRRNGNKTTQLLLLREAINQSQTTEVDVIAVVEGYVADVRCSVAGCGALRTWVPGQAALRRLLYLQKTQE